MIRKYLACARIGVKDAITYRFAFLISMLTSPIGLVIFYFLWKTIFSHTGKEVIRGFTFEAMVSYYALNMIIGFLIWTYIDEDIEHNIITGELTPWLLRPLNYFWEVFFHHLGIHGIAVLVEIIPLSAIAAIFFGLSAPSFINGLVFVIMLCLGIFINFLLSYLVGLTAFWFKQIGGIRRVRRVVVSFLAGSFIPLTFFPDWVSQASKFLPFQYTRYAPITVYLGKHELASALWLLLIALLWAIGLYIISIAVWRKAYKKFAGSGV